MDKQKLIDFLDTIIEIKKYNGSESKAIRSSVFHYTNVIKLLKSSNNEVRNIEELNKVYYKPKSKIYIKLKEYIVNQNYPEEFESQDYKHIKSIKELRDVYGIGQIKAKKLVTEHNINSVDELRERQNDDKLKLTNANKLGLLYYEDILERIPRKEIDEYEELLNTIFEKITTEGSNMKIVGSYRRGLPTSGDIDIIISHDECSINDEDKDILKQDTFDRFINILEQLGIIVGNLTPDGKTKQLVLAKIPNSDKVRRVDFLWTYVEEYPFSILYFTGSWNFNVIQRDRAREKNMTLCEHGIYHLTNNGKKGKRVDHIFKSEKDIFDYLDMKYVSPEER